jgi:glycolate oxidase FAD binding subunit
VLPRAETENTLLVLGLGDVAAADAMTAAMGSACDVSAAAHVPAGVARRLPAHSVAVAGRAVTALRLEGVAPSVAHRRQLLAHLLRPFGPLGVLDGPESQALWGALRDALPFARDTSRALWRISTAPSQGARFGSLVAAGADAELFYDWAGGLVWAAVPPGDDAGAMVIRSAVAATGGHATLIRAPVAVRAAVDVFPPQDPVHGALTKRIKESFDPAGILNRGRMYAGI